MVVSIIIINMASAGSRAASATPGQAPQQAPQQSPQQSPPTMVNFTPLSKLGDSYGNLNPAMNTQGRGNVQVMNVLDGGSQSTNLAEYEMTDIDFLEGLPGTMFDWRKCLM
jgi:hypothetical protein